MFFVITISRVYKHERYRPITISGNIDWEKRSKKKLFEAIMERAVAAHTDSYGFGPDEEAEYVVDFYYVG